MMDIGKDLQNAYEEGYKQGYEQGEKDALYMAVEDLQTPPISQRSMYQAGYRQAQEDRQRGEWVDCKELPSTDRNVFIAYGTDDMKSVCIGHYSHDMKLWYEDKNFFAKPIYDAMYWCEIPQFPTRMKGADEK